jgi:hypothetical protein
MNRFGTSNHMKIFQIRLLIGKLLLNDMVQFSATYYMQKGCQKKLSKNQRHRMYKQDRNISK